MNVGKKISFTGAMLVNGDSNQLKTIETYIANKAFLDKYDNYLEMSGKKNNFEFKTISLRDGDTVLFTTKDEASRLYEFCKNNSISDGFIPPKFTIEEVLKDIGINNLTDIPKFTTEEVWEAMKKRLFDFANLKIKRSIPDILKNLAKKKI